MLPWWISWLLRWWACTVCSLTILLSSCQPTLGVGHGWVEVTSRQFPYNESSNGAKNDFVGDEFSLKIRKDSYEDKLFNDGEFNYQKYHHEHAKSFPVRGAVSLLFPQGEDSLSHRTFTRKKQRERSSQMSQKRLLEERGSSPFLMDTPEDKTGDTKPNTNSPHLSSHRDITSLEVPSIPRENVLPGNRFQTTLEITPHEDSDQSGVRKLSRIISHTNSKSHPMHKVNKLAHVHKGKRILKTLVTTPKRIIGSLQGMGGSAVKPAGSSIQHFATQPAPQTAVVGSTAVLPCRVMGKVGHLQWTKDGFGLGTDRNLFGFSRYSMIGDDDEGDYSLRIQPVMLSDDALFQCQVSAIDGIPGIRSKPVRLTVYVPPEPPQVSPPILETTAGTSVTLKCTSVGGRPPPEIQWVDDSRRESIHEGSVVSSDYLDDRKRSVVKSRLSFTPSRSHDNQTITCVTSNQALSSPLTSSIFLSVMFPPEVRLTSYPETLIEGDDVTFVCDAQANPSLLTYRWFLSGLPLANKTARSFRLHKISRSIHLNEIACEVSNRVGTSKENLTIAVRYGPTFRSMPRDVMSEEGEEAILKCNVNSNPEANIVWLRDGSNKIIGSGPSLLLRVNGSSAGVYKCVARVRGRDYEFPELVGHMKLLLKGPPTIVSESEQQGRLGDTVTVVCSTVSVPRPIRVTWMYNGREIDLNDPRYEVVEDEGNEKVRNILVIHDAASSDFGSYNCSVVNEYGVARKLITLQPEKRIPIMLVVGCGAATIGIVVVGVCLVFCNKKHDTVKETSSRLEKDMPEVTQLNDGRMYSGVPTNQKPSEESTGFTVSQRGIQISPSQSSNPQYSIDRRKSYHVETPIGTTLMHSLSGEIDHKAQPHSVTFEEDYLSNRSQSQTNINYPMGELGRRTLTQTSLLTTSPQKYGPPPPSPDYSSLRRIPHSYGIQRGTPLSSQHNGHLSSVGFSKSSLLPNGSANTYSTPKRSPYDSPSSGAWSPTPQPPPYPRNSPSLANGRLANAAEEGRVPSRLSKTLGRNPETKLMYTPGSKLVSGATYL